MMRIGLIILAGLIGLTATPLAAQTPLPAYHPEQEIEIERERTAAQNRALGDKKKQLAKDLKKKKSSLVSIAADIKKNEQTLNDTEIEIAAKTKEKEALLQNLAGNKEAFAAALLLLHRVERTPPQAVILSPGGALQAARSAMLLENALPRLQDKTEAMQDDLLQLGQTLDDLNTAQDRALKTAAALEKDRKKLDGLLKEREILYAQTARDAQATQAALARLSAEARNLRDLVQKVERKRKEEERRAKERQARQSKPAPKPKNTPASPPSVQQASLLTAAQTPLPRSGRPQSPLAGTIKARFGETDAIGARAQGVRIAGPANALIVAPMGGRVEFAGPFKGYGKIVILRHEKDWHSLIAGLAKIDTVVGRNIAAGEPLGHMGVGADAQELYYELRHRGKAVAPSQKIKGL